MSYTLPYLRRFVITKRFKIKLNSKYWRVKEYKNYNSGLEKKWGFELLSKLSMI